LARHLHTHDGLIAFTALAPLVGVVLLAAFSALTGGWKTAVRSPKARGQAGRQAPLRARASKPPG
jgi:hypothetical protein